MINSIKQENFKLLKKKINIYHATYHYCINDTSSFIS